MGADGTLVVCDSGNHRVQLVNPEFNLKKNLTITIKPGQTGRLQIRNHSMMSHPLHVHGHTFQLGHKYSEVMPG